MNFEAYKNEVQDFANRGNYHAAINIALSGLNACRREQDQNGIDQCLAVIEGVIRQLGQEYGGKAFTEK